MSLMELDSYNAKIEYCAERDCFRGEILGLNGAADFYGHDPDELRSEFRKSLHTFLDVCKERQIDPLRHYSGDLELQIPPKLHARLAIAAQSKGVSINTLVREGLQRAL